MKKKVSAEAATRCCQTARFFFRRGRPWIRDFSRYSVSSGRVVKIVALAQSAFASAKRRQPRGNQDCDECKHHQQLEQCKPATLAPTEVRPARVACSGAAEGGNDAEPASCAAYGPPRPRRAPAAPLEIDAPASGTVTYLLSFDSSAQLSASATPSPSHRTNSAQRPLALLHAAGAGLRRAWALRRSAPTSRSIHRRRCRCNGSIPVRCSPSAQRSGWHAGWCVRGPSPAPAEVADKACPVCGAPLSLAVVVQCPNCLRWTHLEQPGSDDALNCYMAAGVCSCGRAATLEPQVIPEPSAKLLSADEHEWDDAVV